MASETDKMSQMYQNHTIPSRINTTVHLTLGQSNITEAGRGLFVSEPVLAQDLIFKVTKPMLCIVCILESLSSSSSLRCSS
jgi:hypothetical protein